MRLAGAVAVAVAALVLPAAQAADRKIAEPVLGLDVAKNGVQRLAWFDPLTLTTARGHKARLGRFTGDWGFSPDRSVLAIAAEQVAPHGVFAPKLRFVSLQTMRVLGELDVGEGAQFAPVIWLRSDRLLAVVRGDPASIAVVDPTRRVLVRRVTLPRPPEDAVRLPDGIALLLGNYGSFEPAGVAVVDAEGNVRTVTLDRISTGVVTSPDPKIESRSPGFAVDPATRHAFVVGADFTVAEVDLDSLAVTYHGGNARSLAKVVSGPSRSALWLGKGLLAASGADYSGDEQAGQPVGLRIVDTHDWHMRILDPTVGYISRMPNNQAFLATTPFTRDLQHISVYGMDATLRYRFEQTLGVRMLNVQGPYAYVCKKSRVLRILDADNGNTLRVPAAPRPACPIGLLYPQSH
jgi:hypothetical protein